MLGMFWITEELSSQKMRLIFRLSEIQLFKKLTAFENN